VRSTAFGHSAFGADLSRRGLLAAGVAAMGAAHGGLASAADKPFFQRRNLPVGIQLYTLGPDLAKDLDAELATVSKIGFRSVELAGYLGRTPAELRAAFDRAGLVCPSAHIAPKGRRRFQWRSRQAGRRTACDRREVGDHADPVHPRPFQRR
jgi:hypothetical protein